MFFFFHSLFGNDLGEKRDILSEVAFDHGMFFSLVLLFVVEIKLSYLFLELCLPSRL